MFFFISALGFNIFSLLYTKFSLSPAVSFILQKFTLQNRGEIVNALRPRNMLKKRAIVFFLTSMKRSTILADCCSNTIYKISSSIIFCYSNRYVFVLLPYFIFQ